MIITLSIVLMIVCLIVFFMRTNTGLDIISKDQLRHEAYQLGNPLFRIAILESTHGKRVKRHLDVNDITAQELFTLYRRKQKEYKGLRILVGDRIDNTRNQNSNIYDSELPSGQKVTKKFLSTNKALSVKIKKLQILKLFNYGPQKDETGFYQSRELKTYNNISFSDAYDIVGKLKNKPKEIEYEFFIVK